MLDDDDFGQETLGQHEIPNRSRNDSWVPLGLHDWLDEPLEALLWLRAAVHV